MNAYYDVSIKKWRLKEIECVASKANANGSMWDFIEGNIADKEFLNPSVMLQRNMFSPGMVLCKWIL